MKTLRLLLCLLAVLLADLANVPSAAAPFGDTGGWSQETNGLQARLTLVEKDKLHGTRWLVPYLELRNVRGLADRLEVNLGSQHLKVELLGADGKPVRDGRSLSRSGPTPELGTIILPWDSSMRLSLECRNWGIPKDAAAMVSTDSGAWVISEKERGKVFLRASISGEKSEPTWKTWSGTLQTPLLRVDWK
jgi:hypothetical protein